MYWLIQLLINAAVLLLMARVVPGVKVRSFGTAVAVALVIGLLNATIGFLLRLPLNLVTLFLLTFLVRLLVTAIVIRITAKLFKGFDVPTFTTAFLLAIALALAATLAGYLFLILFITKMYIMKQFRFPLFFMGLFCAISLSLTSCKGKTNDADLQAAFSNKVSTDSRLGTISATANDGVLTLTGQCPDESCRSYAEQTAKEIKGVKSVVNNITVAPPAAPVEVSPDAALQTGVRDATKDYPGVTATVNNGEVTLTGTIQRDRLTNLMQSIQSLNPRKVNNNLTIQ